MADAEEYHPLLYVTASIGIAGPLQTTPGSGGALADFLSEKLPRRFSSGKWGPATRVQLPRNALDLLDRSFDLNESFGQGRTQADQFRHRLS
jgi:hypothetical protein